jgi:hypothetical protein
MQGTNSELTKQMGYQDISGVSYRLVTSGPETSSLIDVIADTIKQCQGVFQAAIDSDPFYKMADYSCTSSGVGVSEVSLATDSTSNVNNYGVCVANALESVMSSSGLSCDEQVYAPVVQSRIMAAVIGLLLGMGLLGCFAYALYRMKPCSSRNYGSASSREALIHESTTVAVDEVPNHTSQAQSNVMPFAKAAEALLVLAEPLAPAEPGIEMTPIG